MAAVDLGAQSGRVAVGQLRRLAPRRLRGAPLRQRARRGCGNAPLGHRPALPRHARRPARRRPRRRRSTRSPSTRGASTSACSTASGGLVENPVHYRDARRAAAAPGVFARVPARELYERTGIQLLPINTVFELAAMAAERRPGARRGGRPAADPRPLPPLAVRQPHDASSRTRRRRSASTPRSGGWATDLLERLEIPAAPVPRGRPARDACSARVTAERVGPARRAPTVIAVATHDTGSAVAAVPFNRAGSVYLSVGTWSLVGVEVERPLINDDTFAANLTNEGGVAGTFRLLRNVTGLWLLHECRRCWAERRPRAHVRGARRARADRAAAALVRRPERPSSSSSAAATCRAGSGRSAGRRASRSRPASARPSAASSRASR